MCASRDVYINYETLCTLRSSNNLALDDNVDTRSDHTCCATRSQVNTLWCFPFIGAMFSENGVYSTGVSIHVKSTQADSM